MLLAPAGIAQRRGAHGVLEAERGGAAIPIRSPLPPRTVGVVGSGARSAWPGAGRIGLSGRGRPGVVGSADVDGGGAGRGSGISSSPGSGGEVEDAVAQGLEPSGGQVADDDPRIRAARDLHRQLAQSEDPAQQRVDDIDGLDARQAGDPQLLDEDAAAQVDAVAVHGVTLRPPPQEEEGDHRRDRGQAPHHDPAHDAVGEIDPVSRGIPIGLDQVIDVADGEDGDDRRHDLPALQERGDRVHAAPVDAVRDGDAAPGSGAHRPAILCSPRSASRRRRCSASLTGSPLMVASVLAAAVCSRTSAIPNQAASGPCEVSTYCIRP